MSFGDFFGGYSLIDGTTSGKENLGELISELHNGGVAINCKFDAGKKGTMGIVGGGDSGGKVFHP